MNWLEQQVERLRSANPIVVDGLLAAAFTVTGIASVYAQDIRDESGGLTEGFHDPGGLALVTALLTCVPVAFRRRWPFPALLVSAIGILTHILANWPEGSLPLAALFLTYSVGAWGSTREAVSGLAVIVGTIVVLGVSDSPGLDTVGVFAVLAQFAAGWALGVAVRNRRAATEARVSEADERAEVERQSAARVLAEERLRIAQELHDVVAHSMSVIAVQAGVGAHVLKDRPDQARAALDAISATSRGTLAEMRRLLGVLRNEDGTRAHLPSPGLADLPQLVDDVRAAGVPVELHVEGRADSVHPGVELSAFRIVQEALTNVIKHAGSPTRVEVTVRHLSGSLALEVVDDGRGLARLSPATAAGNGLGGGASEGMGVGLIGMRERVELWGGELSTGPAPGGGYRVKALLPYGALE